MNKANFINHKLELINSTLIPKWYNCLYSSDKNILIYSLSSTIVKYNLSNDNRKIINNKYKSTISNIKYLDKDKNMLLIINKSQLPIINILSINNKDIDTQNSFIYSKIIPVEENFNFSNIFIDRFRYNLFLILLSGINKNILYYFHLNNITNNQYLLIPIGKMQKLDMEIVDFKSFYNTDLIICTTRNSIIYYKMNLESQTCSIYKKVQFQLSIKSKSLKIDRKNGFISIITSKGECFIYDKEGNNISQIRCPFNNKEYFVFNIFSEFNNSLCLATNNGNILIYDIQYKNKEEEYNFKIKILIKNSNINQIIKEKYQINKNDFNYENIQENNNIEIIYYNESNNLIMIYNNSLLSISLSDIINKNFNNNSIEVYQYNHNQKINSGIIIYKSSPNPNVNIDLNYDNIIYTCSNNNILNSCFYNFSKNKFITQNFNFNYILPKGEIHITSIRFHPRYPKDILYAGDSKGFLYIISKQRNFHYQKYNLNDINSDNYLYDNAINLIIFSHTCEYMIYIGFSNGLQKLYDLKVDKNFNYYKLLSNGFFDKNEIQFRQSKSHILNYCYFFIYKNNFKDCFAYLANQKLLKISKFENENNLCISNSYNNDIKNIKYNEPILDIKIHKSENYIIALNNKIQIIVKEINFGKIVSILDFNKIMNYIYSFDLDISGLYISMICDYKNNNKNKIIDIHSNKSSLAIIEINSGKIKSYIKETNYIISKTKFDYNGRYIISLGEKGEISIWKLNQEINNNIIKSIEKIRENFYDFWDNYIIKKNIDIDNNGEIMDEILTEELINKEKYILEFDNYVNQEDFFRINNHGEKSILDKKSMIDSVSPRENNKGNTNFNKSYSLINNNNENNNDISISKNTINETNDYLLEEDHYINRNKYNYKNSSNYIRNNYYNKNIKKVYETEGEKSNSNTYLNSKRQTSRSNSKINNKLQITKEPTISPSKRNKSFRDMIINNKNKSSRNKEIIMEKDNDNKNLETPQFPLSTTNQINKIDLRLFSFNSINEDDKDIFELKKKIIKQSSKLEYNKRRMVNLNNAMNKIKGSNQMFSNTTPNLQETEKENIFNNDNKIFNQKLKNDRYIKFYEKNNEKEHEEFTLDKNNKKYPEPIDIDNNLININPNLFKNDKKMVKIENKNDISNENLYYINNKSGSNLINNMNVSNSNSISLIKEIQNNTNNNSILGKNNSSFNVINMNNNYNINDCSNYNPNPSVGDQISYLENNIKKFEKTFGK